MKQPGDMNAAVTSLTQCLGQPKGQAAPGGRVIPFKQVCAEFTEVEGQLSGGRHQKACPTSLPGSLLPAYAVLKAFVITEQPLSHT